MTNNKLILEFSEIGSVDLPLVGGKGANLGEMTNASFPVPPGFCLTTIAFDQFMNASSELNDIYSMLKKVNIDNIDSVRQIGENIRNMMLNAIIPKNIVNEILDVWNKIGSDNAYAIRSSATAEDLPDASFAGQQDTYLNIIGEKAIIDAIRRCWASLFTDRAILYRIKNNFPHEDVKLSVVIQKMIMSEKSGIMFTADPLTGHRHTLTIDASIGLGEALVSGMVTPDGYAVDKRNFYIIKRDIADKKIAIMPVKEGGTIKLDLNDSQRQQVILDDTQITALAKMGVEIEKHYNSPQDIEWAIVGEKIYLLQTRPITSLYPIESLKSKDANLKVYFSMGHQQSMTKVMSPLTISALNIFVPFGHSESKFKCDFLYTSGGRLFVDITKVLRHPMMKRGLLKGFGQMDMLAPDAIRQVIQRPEFKMNSRTHIPFKFYLSIVSVARRIYKALWKDDVSGFLDKINMGIKDYIAEFDLNINSKEKPRDKLEFLLETMPTVMYYFDNWIPQAIAGIAAGKMLVKKASNWLTPEECENLNLGISGNVVTEMNLMIGDLADLTRKSPELMDVFANLNPEYDRFNSEEWISKAREMNNTDEFIELWDEFMILYGARGPAEIEIKSLRWYEDPLPVLLVIKEFLKKDANHHRINQKKQIAIREANYNLLRDRISKGIFGKRRLKKIDRLYLAMTEIGGMREHHKYFIIRLLRIIKEVLKEIGAELVSIDKINQLDDIWYFRFEEIIKMWDDDTDWKSIIAEKRELEKYYEKLMPNMIMTSDGETPIVEYQIENAPEGALLGNPVAAGIAEGIVHVIHDPVKESIATGEILVAQFTDPGWTPLFINAGGIILEVGGALTHGAVVAREYGIPAVVGVKNATIELKTGQHVRVDGNRGIIEII